jgi:hypothetical protein
MFCFRAVIPLQWQTDKKAKMKSLISFATFVESGIQEACDDACNICLEVFHESDPSAVSSHFIS